MKKALKFIIFKGITFSIPQTHLIAVSFISLLLTLAVGWYIAYIGMLRLLILLLPAYFANMVAFLSSKIKLLNPLEKPVDFNLTWTDGRRVLGDSKTFRGFLSGIATAILVAYIIYLTTLTSSVAVYSSTDEALALGFIAGLGAITGDLVRSFFKRRIGLKTGETWFIFDDLDFVIGALLFLRFYVNFPIVFMVLTLIGSLTLRIFTDIFDFSFKLKKFY